MVVEKITGMIPTVLAVGLVAQTAKSTGLIGKTTESQEAKKEVKGFLFGKG